MATEIVIDAGRVERQLERVMAQQGIISYPHLARYCCAVQANGSWYLVDSAATGADHGGLHLCFC